VTIYLHAAGVERSIKECIALGMRVSGRGAHHVVCEGRDVRFDLKQVAEAEPEGVATLHFALRRSNPKMKSLAIGKTRLAFGPGSRATWYFIAAVPKRKSHHRVH